MSGFCPDDWHGTTEEDLQARSWGEDYHYWADVHQSSVRAFDLFYRAQRRTEYAVHDEAIAQAKRDGLTFHLLPDAEQNARMDAAEEAIRARTAISEES